VAGLFLTVAAFAAMGHPAGMTSGVMFQPIFGQKTRFFAVFEDLTGGTGENGRF